ncbi:unnamed protein product [Prorocentrum cordatum]|nr:unnamed protein product [Polarella glacialis]
MEAPRGLRGSVQCAAMGASFAVAVRSDGAVVSWGCSRHGALGLGAGRLCVRALAPGTVRPAARGEPIVAVSAGLRHVLALTGSGRLLAWGGNAAGQLGVGDGKPRFRPALVEGLQELVQAVASRNMSFAVSGRGQVFAWGDNAGDALALGSGNQCELSPSLMSSLGSTAVSRLEVTGGSGAAEKEHLVIAHAGAPWKEVSGANLKESDAEFRIDMGFWLWGTWGTRHFAAPCRPWVRGRPESAREEQKLRKVVAAGEYFVVLMEDGCLFAWGRSEEGCLGLGDRMVSSVALPLVLPPGPEGAEAGCAVDLQHGRRHLLALSEHGRVYSWGDGRLGQLGLTCTRPAFEPTLVSELASHRVSQILAVRDASYALADCGSVFAWGDNADDALGLPKGEGFGLRTVLAPVKMAGFRGGRITRLEVQ